MGRLYRLKCEITIGPIDCKATAESTGMGTTRNIEMDLFFTVLAHLCVVETLTEDEFVFFLPQLCHQYSTGNLLRDI